MKICAVIPAAGIGSRLGMSMPKMLVPITEEQTVWSIMRDKLLTVVDHINIIISPKAQHHFNAALHKDIRDGIVSLSLQHEPLGMGDAVFCGYPVWSQAQTILVVWGDQVFVSQNTLWRSLQAHAGKKNQLVIPVTHVVSPYVEYIFANSPTDELDQDNYLLEIKQSREGEVCSPRGYSDVGSFVLSVDNIFNEWNQFLQNKTCGQHTGEINFLPFLPYLCKQSWSARTITVPDANEARGINTPDDLVFFQRLLRATV